LERARPGLAERVKAEGDLLEFLHTLEHEV